VSKDKEKRKEVDTKSTVPTPDRLFSAEEQPLEAAVEPLEYLRKRPSYLRYIQSVRRLEEAMKKKATER
jgi:hypothetical protein